MVMVNIKEGRSMICIHCGAEHNQPDHHIIFVNKTQGGTDDPVNRASLCFDCHFAIHHGKDVEKKRAVIATTYRQIKGYISRCWNREETKYKPKVIRLLEWEHLEENTAELDALLKRYDQKPTPSKLSEIKRLTEQIRELKESLDKD